MKKLDSHAADDLGRQGPGHAETPRSHDAERPLSHDAERPRSHDAERPRSHDAKRPRSWQLAARMVLASALVILVGGVALLLAILGDPVELGGRFTPLAP